MKPADEALFLLRLQARKYQVLADAAPAGSGCRRACETTVRATEEALQFLQTHGSAMLEVSVNGLGEPQARAIAPAEFLKETKRMKTAELTGAQLNYWVAKALARTDGVFASKYERPVVFKHWCMVGHGLTHEEFVRTFADAPEYVFREMIFAPSQRWDHGGPIIERDRLHVIPATGPEGPGWASFADDWGTERVQYGSTALIAAMRAKVSSTFGEEVPDA